MAIPKKGDPIAASKGGHCVAASSIPNNPLPVFSRQLALLPGNKLKQ
jgi:hypothetical protein